MQIQARFRIHKKKYKSYEWENAVFYVRREDIDKLRELDGKEVTIIVANSGSTVDSAKLKKYIKALRILNKMLAKASNIQQLISSLSEEEAEILEEVLEEVTQL